MIFVSFPPLLFALSLLHDYVCIANVIGHGCSIGILSADLFLSVQISIRVFRVHQGQRNCRERNNNSMNGSAVMQSNLSGCAFIVCRECFYRDSASPLFFYRFNSFFFFLFLFLSIFVRPVRRRIDEPYFTISIRKQELLLFIFFFFSSFSK